LCTRLNNITISYYNNVIVNDLPLIGVDGSELPEGNNVLVAVGEGMHSGVVSKRNSIRRSQVAWRTEALSFCVRDSILTLPCFQIRNSSKATGPVQIHKSELNTSQPERKYRNKNRKTGRVAITSDQSEEHEYM